MYLCRVNDGILQLKRFFMDHRGRIQVQGEIIEESESWSQNLPLPKEEGLQMLTNLKYRIPKRDAEIRASAFEKASRFIQNGPYQVVERIISKSFKVPDTEQERVDIEILKGKAFE